MMASNARKVRLVAEVLPNDMPLTVLTSQNRVAETLIEGRHRMQPARRKPDRSRPWRSQPDA